MINAIALAALVDELVETRQSHLPRRRGSRCSELCVTLGGGPSVHLAASMTKPGLRTLLSWMKP